MIMQLQTPLQLAWHPSSRVLRPLVRPHSVSLRDIVKGVRGVGEHSGEADIMAHMFLHLSILSPDQIHSIAASLEEFAIYDLLWLDLPPSQVSCFYVRNRSVRLNNRIIPGL